MTRTLRLVEEMPDPWVEEYEGKYLDEGDYTVLVGREDSNVLRPDGTPLLMYRSAAVPADACSRAYPALVRAARPTFNRGTAAGGRRTRRRKLDGSLSRTVTAQPVPSGIIGFYDRAIRTPYCRTTAYTYGDPRGWSDVLPFAQAADRVFRWEAPDRYAAQVAAVERTPAEWVIPGTAFTTITVNRNWPTAVHKDEGDLPAGFGVMCVLRRGEYAGCRLVFPKYGVAVEMNDGDVLLADVHEWHGNTPLIGVSEVYDRIAVVMYFRERMQYCGTADEEFERLKRRKFGDRLF